MLSLLSFNIFSLMILLTQFQRVYRGSRGREKCKQMLLHRTASRFSAKYKAAEKLKRAMQRFVKRIKVKRERSALVIQNAARGQLACKKVSSLREAERLRAEQKRLAEESSRQKLLEAEEMDKAAGLIGRMARDRYAVKDARGYRDRLLSERNQRERDAQAAGDKLKRETEAALLIQATSRGR